MKIYKQIIATGIEWKPCVHCDKRFVYGEIITALTNDTGSRVDSWYCSECFERFWFYPLPVPVERDDDFCMVVIKDNKVQVCPKRMSPEEYMIRKTGTWRQESEWRYRRL